MKMDKELEKLISLAVNFYSNKYYDLQRIPINYIITENLDEKHRELRPDIAGEITGENLHSDDNGRMIPPMTVDEPMNVVLNMKIFSGQSVNWTGTLAHEITHAIDYYQMAKINDLKDYSSLERGYIFPSWSEYHAKKIGYSFLRTICDHMNIFSEKEKQIEEITNVEWPHFMNEFYNDYHKHGNDGVYQIYLTMHILGRYSAWNDLFPDYFNLQKLSIDFCNTPWVEDLYCYLREHETIELFSTSMEEFKYVLSKNWKGQE